MSDTNPTDAPLTQIRLLALLREREAGVVLVEERILRRVVREDLGLSGVAPRVPHQRCYALPRGRLARFVEADELDVPLAELPEWVYLLPTPGDDLDAVAADQLLRRYWRRLFHARVDAELRIRTAGVSLPRSRVLAHIDAIGQTPFDEIRAVLADEALIPEAAGEVTEFIEFVALYLELRHFAPALLDRFFPSLRAKLHLEEMLATLVDGHGLLQATRPRGAAERAAPDDSYEAPEMVWAGAPGVSPRRAAKLLRKAVFVRERGNDAGAAVLCARARVTADDALVERAHETGERALASLGKRLSALTHGVTQAEAWSAVLEPLTEAATHGMRRLEARLLHDLQKACVEAERHVFEVDLGRWIRHLGRDPVRRPLTARGLVDIARHLRRARARLAGCHLDAASRERLRSILDDAVHVTSADVRRELGALIHEALDGAGLRADDVPGRAAADKLVAELLDLLLARGFIAFGDVRDVLAKNELKLPDLRGVGEFFRGDPLLRLDHLLERRLDRAYQRGEIYRRGLQRLSSLGFANPLGRLIVLYALLPFGGAFVLLEGLQHIVGPLVKLFGGPETHILTPASLLALGGVLLALIHLAAVRRAAITGLHLVGDAGRTLFVTVPERFRELPPVRWLRGTRAWRFFRERLWRPLQLAVVPLLLTAWIAWSWTIGAWVGLGAFVGGVIFLSYRAGRRLEEELSDRLGRGWYHFAHSFVPGLVSAVLAFFKAVVNLVEISLYQVDQWLRFRRGDSAFSLAAKAVFGLLWSFVAYIFRFGVNLLFEPQVNPIKHFPVVTVSHKLILPMTPQFIAFFENFFSTATAASVGVATVTTLPGVFGFLVWEFKENWRMYAANRKPALSPMIVGSHGETVYRLLRPGFHSGTVPKLFKKLRRAERRRDLADIHKHADALHHVEEAIAHFITRDLVAVLRASGRLPRADALEVHKVTLTPYRIIAELVCEPLGAEPLELLFDEQARFLVAGLGARGWLTALPAEGLAALETALLGFYKHAGVDLVREQIVSILPGKPPYDVDAKGLIVWPGDGFETEAVYPLRSRAARLRPRVRGPGLVRPLPVIAVGDIFFKRRPLPWSRWVAAWAPAQSDPDPLRDLFGPLSLLDDDSLRNASVAPRAERPAEPAALPGPQQPQRT